MKKENYICDSPTAPAANNENNKIELNDNIYYNCTECSSLIEIISINEQSNMIEFKCLSENNNHERKKMSLTEYLNKKNKFYQKKINDDNCEVHKHNKYVAYCFDCNLHLCKECLKTRKHINHNKNNIIEIQPTKEELDIIKEVIEDYNIRINDLKKENFNKIKELEIILNQNKIYENENIEETIKTIKENEQNELKINENKYISDIKEINLIKNTYKLINEKENIIHIYKIKELDRKFNEDVEKLNNDIRIGNMNNMKRISEIVYNSYIAYNYNYYNAMNINNIILSYYKNEYTKNKIIKKILKNDYQENFIEKKEKERKKLDKKYMDSILKGITDEYDKKINKIKKENEKQIKEYENKIIKIKEKYEEELKELNDIKEKSKKYKMKYIEFQEKIKEVNNEIMIIYKIDKNENSIRLFGKDFVNNNKNICKIIYDEKEYELQERFYLKNLNKNKEILEIKLRGITNVITMNSMFDECSSLLSVPDISKWNTINITDMGSLFAECISLTTLPDISKWNTINVKNMSDMFFNCKSLTTLPDISKWNTINVTNFGSMFSECTSLVNIPDISKWNTYNAQYMCNMFSVCSSLSHLPDISKWNTINVKDMNSMFDECKSLTYLPDISKWNTINVKNMKRMFGDCSSLISLPNISKWNITNIINKEEMFKGCKNSLNVPTKFK